MRIDAKGLHYRVLNEKVHASLAEVNGLVTVDNLRGQRYIGCGLTRNVRIVLNGTPGNDLAAFMSGPEIVVNGNAQDAVGNTMNSGKVIIHGDAGDVVAHSMRGGKIFVKGSTGYRTGIHMKSYREHLPVVVVGSRVGDYAGEYMAGGILIVLGLDVDENDSVVGEYVGTGMHGGKMYIRKPIEAYQLGKEVGMSELVAEDREELARYLEEFRYDLNLTRAIDVSDRFVKLVPVSSRPYGKIYAY